MSTAYNTIVVGLGAAGGAALYQLARRKDSVLGLDQFSPPHALGSSHGDTRITRQAIGEGVQYTPIVLRAYEIIREMEQKTNRQLLQVTGGLMMSSPGSGGIHNKEEFFANMLSAASRYGIKHDLLDAAEIRRRFPQFKVKDVEQGYFEYQSGLLYAERCVATQLELAESFGAVVQRDEKMLSFSESGSGVKVVTDRGEYQAEQLVIAAGPWVSELVNPGHAGLFEVQRQVQFWFDVQNCYEQFAPDKFPIFIWELGGDSDSMYGFPAIDGASGGFKVGCASYNKVVTPHTIDRDVSAEEIETVFDRQIRPFFSNSVGGCIKTRVCLYTTTPDSDFVVDRLKEMPAVVLCSPCSGHGFKHAVAIGEGVAEMVLDGKSKQDFSYFKLDRFNKKLISDG